MRRFQIILILLAVLLIADIASAADFSVHGYYRNRVVANDDLDLQQPNRNIPYTNSRFGFVGYNQMRLRLMPNFKLNDYLSVQAQLDVLDNIVYGTNSTQQLSVTAPVVGPQTLPPGAGSFYMTGPATVGPGGAINVRRIWMDVLSPVGKFRVGRQPSNWGLGIFQNDGNELQGDFGDTADRILYLLQYDVVDTGTITGGLLWDYAYTAQFDPRINGLATPESSYSRSCQQYAGVFMFERPEFTAGLFTGLRRRKGPTGATTMQVTDALGNTVSAGIDGYTLLYFADLYARYTWENYNFKFEGIYIGGKVTTGLALNAIPFAGLGAGQGIIELPARQDMQVFMAAFEAEGSYKFGGAWKFQAGYAPGDSTPLSQKVTQLGFRPDYQIALMMFNMPLGTSPSLYGQRAGGGGGTEYLAGGQSITSNYVNNALYLTAGYKHKFDISSTEWGNWVKVGAKAITAWAPKKNTNISFSSLIPQPGNWPALSDTASSMFKRWYGMEIDISGEAQMFEHLYAALETGVLIPGRAYDIDVQLIDPGSIVEPVPRDKANMAWMIRLSTILEF